MERARPRAGLILTGGGARAAYQVGVLKAIRDLLPDQAKHPFPDTLRHFGRRHQRRGAGNPCRRFSPRRGLPAGGVGELPCGSRLPRRSLVHAQTAPAGSPRCCGSNATARRRCSTMRRYARRWRNPGFALIRKTSTPARSMQFPSLLRAIPRGERFLLSGRPGLEAWERTQRVGAATTLDVDYLMASSALPFFFLR